MKLALCQMEVVAKKAKNLERAKCMLQEAAQKDAQIAILPEMFTVPYVPELFLDAAECCEYGPAAQMLAQTAKDTGLWIVGGSIPEQQGAAVYNTSMVFDGTGRLVGKYRKAHLFDVQIPNRLTCSESDAITKGDTLPLIVNGPVKMSVAICFDIRFPEWIALSARDGADLLALPAAFSRVTGPKHWELLLRARAVDNQMYVAGISPAQCRTAYGHSLLVAPDGTVLCDCGEGECVAVVDINLQVAEQVRQAMPLQASRRLNVPAGEDVFRF